EKGLGVYSRSRLCSERISSEPREMDIGSSQRYTVALIHAKPSPVELDTLLSRSDGHRVDDDDVAKDSAIDEYFEQVGPTACRPSFVAAVVNNAQQQRGAHQHHHHHGQSSSSSSSSSSGHHSLHQQSSAHVTTLQNNPSDDDVFLRPPLWEDITSSIQKLDPENADMLGQAQTVSHLHVKLENLSDDQIDPMSSPQPVLSPQDIKPDPQSLSQPTLHLLEAPTSSSSYIAAANRQQHHRTNAFKLFPCTNNNNPSTNNNNSIHNNCNVSSNSTEQTQATNNNSSNNNNSNNSNGALSSLTFGSMSRLMYVSPLTPPISDPGSPLAGGPSRRTPPPPYPQIQLTTSNSNNPGNNGLLVGANSNNAASGLRLGASTTTGAASANNATSGTVGHTTKFNRRNNPELEKRRVHHCDFRANRQVLGMDFLMHPRPIRVKNRIIATGRIVSGASHARTSLRAIIVSTREQNPSSVPSARGPSPGAIIWPCT
ncbi:unnamed protein product, partial [Trichogramma brassicae]